MGFGGRWGGDGEEGGGLKVGGWEGRCVVRAGAEGG